MEQSTHTLHTLLKEEDPSSPTIQVTLTQQQLVALNYILTPNKESGGYISIPKHIYRHTSIYQILEGTHTSLQEQFIFNNIPKG